MAVYVSILDTIGHTPVVKLQRIAPEHVTLYAKVESFNPGGSVKDRLALAIVLDAEAKGLLKPGDTIIEATSGNTGVALAMVAAARGYKFVATMVETFSIERRKLMRAYGAKVILTPAAERGTGMVRKAKELAEQHGWFLASQFANPANPAYHRNTTAAEILRDFAGQRLDYFVSGWGTGGTLTGVGEVLRVVESLAGDGMTLLMVTHEMNFARKVADRVVFMHAGRIHEMGPPDELFTAPRTPELQQFLAALH